MTNTYPAMVAWDASANIVATNTIFQVYATTDVGFTVPLNITDPFGNAVPGNQLSSGSVGVIPEFGQADYQTVVITDLSHTYSWTIICIQPPTQDAAVASYVASSGSATASALRQMLPAYWQPNTAYTAGQTITSPGGNIMQANTAFTSGGTFSAANWTLVGSGASVLARTNLCQNGWPTTSTGWSWQLGTSEASAYTLPTSAGPDGQAGFLRRTITTAKTGGNSGAYRNETISGGAGDDYTSVIWVRSSVAITCALNVTAKNGGTTVTSAAGAAVSLTANVWTKMSTTLLNVASAYNTVQSWVIFNASQILPVGATFDVARNLVEATTSTTDSYFDGSTPASSDVTYAWTGPANASTSNMYTTGATFLTPAQRGIAGGVASLDASTKIPTGQIPDLSGQYLTTGTNILVGSQGYDKVHVGKTRVLPGVDSAYSAFPGATQLPDGRLFMVWRQGTDHINTRDGKIMGSYSSDLGQTWTTAVVLIDGTGDTLPDLRDPNVSMSTDKSTIYLTYIRASATLNAGGFYLKKSTDSGVTWGSEYRIDQLAYAAGTSPIITLPSGNLFATWYGKLNSSDANDSVWYATSTTGGNTWSASVKLVDGLAPALDMQEPYASIHGNTVVLMHRWGNALDIGVVRSTDGGVTWGTSAIAFTQASGRPGNIITANGTLLCIYRNYQSTNGYEQHGMLRTSRDFGVTWTAQRLVESANPSFWTYSAMVEIRQGVIFTASGTEVSFSSSSYLSARYLLEGGGTSPWGDTTPNRSQRVLERVNTIGAIDDFDRADTSSGLGQTLNGINWASTGGAHINQGTFLDQSTASQVHYVPIASPDQDVEAEFLWNTQAGYYLVFRAQDTSNYLMAGIETSGTNARIYKVVAGAATQLATSAISLPADVYHKMRVSAVGNNIRMYVEDIVVNTVTDSTFNTKFWCGVRSGGNSGVTHRVRNFVARRRSGILS